MKYQLRANLQTKVILSALVIALAPLIILAMLDNWAVRKNLTNVANQSLSIAAEQTANRIDQFLQKNLLEVQATGQLRSFAQYLKLAPEVRPGSREENDVSTIFRTLSRKNLLLPTPYALLDEAGVNVFDFEPWRIGADESRENYFKKPFQTGQLFISQILFSPGSNRQAHFYISGPVFNVAGNIVGVVRVSISIAFIQDFIANTSGLAGLESFGLLMDTNHFILAHSQNPEMVFRTSRHLTVSEFKQLQVAGQIPRIPLKKLTVDLPEFEKQMQRGTSATVFSAPLTQFNKQPEQIALAQLKQHNWLVLVAQPQTAFLEPVKQQFNSTLLLVSIIAVVVTFLAVLVSRQLTQPILNMTAIARKIAVGDLTTQVPELSHDELGELAQTLNVMARQLLESIGLLKESEAKYRRLHESIADAYAAVNMDGQIIETNPAFLDLVGYSHDELITKTYEDLTPHKWKSIESEIIKKQVLKRGYSELYEKEYIKKDGGIIPVELRTFLLRDDDENPQMLWAIVRDLTERKKTQDRLLRSEQRYSLISAASKEGVFDNDLVGKDLYASDRWMEIHGLNIGDEPLDYSSWRKMVHPEDIAKMEKSLQDHFEGKTPMAECEYRIIDGHGQQKWLKGRALALSDDANNSFRLFGTVSDITEQREIEKEKKQLQNQLLQAQKMESIGQLAGGVAHDYNNLSSIIIGYTEMAMQDALPGSSLQSHLEKVLTAANRSTDITRQLLAFARRQTIAPEILDLNGTIGKMLDMFQRLIGENIDLLYRPGSGVWQIKMDKSQLDQIMANLCVNARDAIKDVGKVTVETNNITFDQEYCDDHHGFSPGEYVLLSFSDNGVGMEPDILENIFEPFFTTKELGKGTGLGLSTLYGIVKQNKGFINVYSEPRRGTTFRIYLPRHKGSATDISTIDKFDKNEMPLGKGETVLLVEDDKLILELAEKILGNLGYVILAFASPLEALRLTEKQDKEISLLITDVVMPEMNGKELSKRLKRQYQNLKTLFMSGYTANVIAHQGVLEDDVLFISKPFSINELAVKVRESLDGN